MATSPAAPYTCPMHPEVRLPGPGACPICGMGTELRAPAGDGEEDGGELSAMTRRLLVTTALTVPLLLLSMIPDLPDAGGGPWVQLGLASPVVLWGGAPFFQRGWSSVRSGHLNMFTLIALGTGVAFADSLVATVAPGLFPASFHGKGGSVPLYFEAAAAITTLVLLGQVLELRARRATSGAIRALLALAPRKARIVTEAGEEDISLDRVAVGDRLRVRPGERVPVDGVVLGGESAIDESTITGEPIPVAKQAGDPVTGGTLNGRGALLMRAERVGEATVLARIVRMVGEAQRSRAPIQRVADSVAGRFVPAVIAAAVVTFVGWAAFGPEPRMAHGLVSAVSVLIIACPCALGLATPMSIMVGVGRGAREGVLIRDAEAIERLEKIDTLVTDKTGTLTEGKPSVVRVVPLLPVTEAELLGVAAALEVASEHPLGSAIVEAARRAGVTPAAASDVRPWVGGGIEGTAAGRHVVVGSAAWLAERGIDVGASLARLEELQEDGSTAVLVAIDQALAGIFVLRDRVKEHAKEAIRRLRAAGIRVVMMTGDGRAAANAVARELGIDDVQAELLPDQKAQRIRALRESGRVVAMAGDGVNDAPALATADVGIAMGTGADVAMQSAGVTLVKGDLDGIARAVALSRRTMRNIRQNLFFAFLYNAAGVPIAAGALYPVFGIVLSPMIAGAAMSLSSVSVIGNALRLRAAPLVTGGRGWG
jgi:Cu+-exporting ATPase